MKKKILVLGGGFSKERTISLKSAKAVIKSIKKTHKVKFADPSDNFLKTFELFHPCELRHQLHLSAYFLTCFLKKTQFYFYDLNQLNKCISTCQLLYMDEKHQNLFYIY